MRLNLRSAICHAAHVAAAALLIHHDNQQAMNYTLHNPAAPAESPTFEVGAPDPIPADILAELVAYEAERLNLPPEDTGFDGAYVAYFPRWVSGGPGYVGPLVVVSWGAGVDAVSTFYKAFGKWTLAAQWGGN